VIRKKIATWRKWSTLKKNVGAIIKKNVFVSETINNWWICNNLMKSDNSRSDCGQAQCFLSVSLFEWNLKDARLAFDTAFFQQFTWDWVLYLNCSPTDPTFCYISYIICEHAPDLKQQIISSCVFSRTFHKYCTNYCVKFFLLLFHQMDNARKCLTFF